MQDKYYRQLYAATSHDDFLEASAAAAAAGGGGGGGAVAGAGKSVKGRWKGPRKLLSPLVLNPHLGLMDVLENHTCFTYQVSTL